MNVVNELKTKIQEKAEKVGLSVRFAQTNHSKFACTSRVYIYPVGARVHNYRSNNVIAVWQFNQAQSTGATKQCERYRVYSTVLNYLENY